MFKFITKLLTKKFTEIPLFIVNFNLEKYRQDGKKNSCMAIIHPVLKDDEHIEATLKELIDYIRDNYEMEELI